MRYQCPLIDFICVHEWRDFQIKIRRFPQGPAFTLEAEGSKCSIVGTTSRNTRTEKIGVRQKIRGHKGAVTVTADSNTVRVRYSQLGVLVYRGLCAHHDLLNICIVHSFRIANYWHSRIIKYCVTLK